MLSATSTRIFRIAIVALALTLGACGGGGGGGTTPTLPNPGGGGNPPPASPSASPSGSPTGAPTTGPTAKPTANPTAKPTTQPTSVPTQAPTASPPPQTQSITMLPDTRGRFSLMQINDSDGVHPGMSNAQIQAEAPHFDAVWGAFSPQTWNSAHNGMYVSRYILPNEDEKPLSGHDLTWWQSNHPDWILYACQPDGTPTHDLAYFFTGFGDVPLDIHNQQVVDYQVGLLQNYLSANGYNALAIDNVEFDNYSAGPNPEFGEGSVQPGWYGCGVWQGNTFVRRYSGPRLASDATWNADTLNWLQTARNALSPRGIKILINHPPFDASPDPNETTMLQDVDGMLDENGFTHYGSLLTGKQFMNTLGWMEYAQNHGKAIFITDYFCSGSSCSTDPNSLTASQVDWALATYAIGNNGGAGVFISPKGGAIYTYRAEYAKAYGTPCGAYTVNGALVSRSFTGGFAVANSGTSAQSITLPAGHAYSDIGGRPVSNPLTVNGTDAYMLTTSGNGCM